jgi:hypothetical protein
LVTTTQSSEFHVDEFAVIGRTYAEYLYMFDLKAEEIRGRRILDRPAGVASFAATASERGASVVGVDPVYDRPATDLARQCRADFRSVADQIRAKTDLFDWEYYGSWRTASRTSRRPTSGFSRTSSEAGSDTSPRRAGSAVRD